MRCFAVGVGLWFLFAVSMWSAGSEQPSATHFSSLPATAQSSISAAIGRDDTAYAARRLGEDFHVDGLHSHLTVDFNSKGVSLQAGDARWGLALLGYGYGEELRPLAVVSPQCQVESGGVPPWIADGVVRERARWSGTGIHAGVSSGKIARTTAYGGAHGCGCFAGHGGKRWTRVEAGRDGRRAQLTLQRPECL
jgi:hypothetical protein